MAITPPAGQHAGLLAEVAAQLDGEQVVLLLSGAGEDSVGVVVLPATTMISFASLRLTSTEAMPGSPLCVVTSTEMTGWAAVLPTGETGLPLLAASSLKSLCTETPTYRHQARLSERLRYRIHMPIEVVGPVGITAGSLRDGTVPAVVSKKPLVVESTLDIPGDAGWVNPYQETYDHTDDCCSLS